MYQCTKSHWQKCLVHKFCCVRLFVVVYTLVIVVLDCIYRVSLSENLVIGRNVSLRLRMFVVVYKLVILALRYTLYQCTKSYRQKS